MKFLLLLTIACVSYCVVDSVLIDGRLLQQQLQKVADDALGVSEMQKAYDKLQYEPSKINGAKEVDEITLSISQRFSGILSALDNLREVVEKTYDSSTTSTTMPVCCMATGTTYDTRFRSEINDNEACVASPSAFGSGVTYPPPAVEEAMKDNYQKNKNLLWQYFGSESGTFMNYPSVKLPFCDYEPRFRPYYASGASPKPKDVVITIDTSSSMSKEYEQTTLMQIAKEAAVTVIRTLNPNDRVGIVSFNSIAKTPQVRKSTCFSSELAMATADNTDKLEDYVNGLSFDGGTNYEEGLRSSFAYFQSSDRSLQGEERDRAILFLTDGEKDQGADPLTVIREENGALNNSVIILTYGLGSTLSDQALSLLKNMSLQLLNDASKGEVKFGKFEHIQNPSDLVAAMGSYYNFLRKSESGAAFTVPFKDLFSKIGLVTSVCLPAYSSGGKGFIGVVCTDVKISDLQSEMSVFDNDEKSYSFMIDGYGRTLIHPLLPQPWGVTDDVILIDIEHFERSLKSTRAIDQMKRGEDGEIIVQNTVTLPRGQALYEGITTSSVKSKYVWRKIPDTNYTVCIVIGDDTKYTPKRLTGSDEIFQYHRRHLSSDNLNNCRFFARFATIDKTLVMLTASAFVEPYKYLDETETEATVKKYENYFRGKSIDLDFKSTVLTSVVVTHQAETLWKGRQSEARYLIWRYLATEDGVVRTYPGVEIKKDFDPKLRPWYKRTIAFKGDYVLSAPYRDGWGAGYLLTLSAAIFRGRQDHIHNSKNETVVAVMGADIPIYYFYQMLIRQYPICNTTQYRCFVIDSSGFVVMHSAFTSAWTDPKLDSLYHITELEGTIARDLITKNILTKRSCTDFQSVKDQITYRVRLTSLYTDGVDMTTEGNYEMRPVHNSNIFLLIKKTTMDVKPCCAEQHDPGITLCNLDSSVCECMCYRGINFDYCRNRFISSDASSPCSAQAPDLNTEFKEEKKIEGLDLCFETNCDERSSEEKCYYVAGCSWCVFKASGSTTKPPFCDLSEVCPLGRCINDSNCKGKETGHSIATTPSINRTNPPESKESNSLALVLGVGGSVGVVLIVMVIVFIRCRKSDYLTAVDVNKHCCRKRKRNDGYITAKDVNKGDSKGKYNEQFESDSSGPYNRPLTVNETNIFPPTDIGGQYSRERTDSLPSPYFKTDFPTGHNRAEISPSTRYVNPDSSLPTLHQSLNSGSGISDKYDKIGEKITV